MFRLAAGTAVGIALAGLVLAGAAQNPVPSTPKSIDNGRQSFQKYCKGCHGEDATGDGPQSPKDVHPPNLTDAEWKFGATDNEIFKNIHDGVGPNSAMKSWKSRMTDAEIWNVVNYLRSIGPKPSP
jgi:cbb3-type cytochrome c oxidase subunit III